MFLVYVHRLQMLIRCELKMSIKLSLCGLLALAACVRAQEPISAESATQPSPGHFTLKHQFQFREYRSGNLPRGRRGDVRDLQFLSTLILGLDRDLSLSLKAPVVFRRTGVRGTVDREEGFRDVSALLKWRFLRDDSSALNTTRMSLLAGAEIRTGDGALTNDGYNPMLGLALTRIDGRHGINADLIWTFTTNGIEDPVLPGMSSADLLRYDAAYLYRLAPAKYSEDTKGAWYALAELNGSYETNGDHELFLSPGLMYEATTWALELSLQWPVVQELDHRPESEYAFIAGVRFSF